MNNIRRAFLSLGGNIGDREGYLRYGISRLDGLEGSNVASVSSIYKTKPWGPVEQDDFLNCCVELHTPLSPMELLEKMHEIEDACGRTREVRYGPRTLDIDLLLYEGYSSTEEVLHVPHSEMATRSFVMVPLLEIWDGKGDFSFDAQWEEGDTLERSGSFPVESFYEMKGESESVYKGKILNVRRDVVLLPDGESGIREVVEHTGGVAVVAIDHEENVLLVRQFRYPMSRQLIEIPAGTLMVGEDPKLCGIRELKEETGAVAASFESLGIMYPCAGFTNEIIHLYVARDLTFEEMELDEGEFLSVFKMPLKEAVGRIMAGEICDGKTALGILKAWHNMTGMEWSK